MMYNVQKNVSQGLKHKSVRQKRIFLTVKEKISFLNPLKPIVNIF